MQELRLGRKPANFESVWADGYKPYRPSQSEPAPSPTELRQRSAIPLQSRFFETSNLGFHWNYENSSTKCHQGSPPPSPTLAQREHYGLSSLSFRQGLTARNRQTVSPAEKNDGILEWVILVNQDRCLAHKAEDWNHESW
jgi:hypothetical protein